jgi:hypothetical protein
MHRRLGADSDKISEDGASTYILHLSGLNYGLTCTERISKRKFSILLLFLYLVNMQKT